MYMPIALKQESMLKEKIVKRDIFKSPWIEKNQNVKTKNDAEVKGQTCNLARKTLILSLILKKKKDANTNSIPQLLMSTTIKF